MSDAARKLLNNAYFYLRFRARTEQEMRTYLGQKAEKHQAVAQDIEEVIQELYEIDLLDDKRFIEEYIASRSRNKPRGKYALTQELLHKGIARSLIEAYFVNHKLDEEQLAFAALQKVWPRYSHLDGLKKYKRAADYLSRRGFRFSVIQKTIKAM